MGGVLLRPQPTLLRVYLVLSLSGDDMAATLEKLARRGEKFRTAVLTANAVLGAGAGKVSVELGGPRLVGQLAPSASRCRICKSRSKPLLHSACCKVTSPPYFPPMSDNHEYEARKRPRACTRFRAQRENTAVEGDSSIFADTSIGTVPSSLAT